MSKTQRNKRVKREQPRKDNRSKRVNFDNERISKFDKDRAFKDPGTTKASNDVKWYATNPELLRSAASLPFSTTTGLPLPWTTADTEGNDSSRKVVPGILTLSWCPSIGGAFIDPINQAANSTYSFVVHANSRSKSYDAPDLMQMILCGASLFSMIAHGIRAYGVMRTFDQRNAYLPKALVSAMGFNYEDLRSNLSHMWFDLNELIARAQQIWIPKNFPFIERWFWLNSNIYMDAESIKSQYYMFVPRKYLVYNAKGDFADNNHLANASLKVWTLGAYSDGDFMPQGYNQAGHTWEQYMEVIDSMFTPLLQSQDRGIIYGDILKAYGTENIYALQPITSDYQVVPIYDKEVLTQIENATVSNCMIESFDQDPKTNKIYESFYTPSSQPVRYTGVPAPDVQVLNFHQVETPTPEQIMVATRLKSAGMASIPNGKGSATLGGTTSGGWAPKACGTEVIYEVNMWFALSSDTSVPASTTPAMPAFTVPKGEFARWTVATNVTADTSAVNSIIGSWDKLSNYIAFDWAPWIYRVNYTAPWGSAQNTAIDVAAMDKGGSNTQSAVGDYDYYTTIDINELRKMHQTAIYSEFGVPTI